MAETMTLERAMREALDELEYAAEWGNFGAVLSVEVVRTLLAAAKAREGQRELRAILTEVRGACLFIDDDGQIGVTQDPHIPETLFARICHALLAVTTRETEEPAKLNKCPHSFSTTCEQYRLQGQRCQECPLVSEEPAGE